MRYDPPLLEGRLLKRYKRFLADVHIEPLPLGAKQLEGEAPGVFTSHCANPGSMRGLAVQGARVWVHDSGNPKRKLRYSLELIETREGASVCVNTARANQVVIEALKEGRIPEVIQYQWKPEVKWSGRALNGETLDARFDVGLYSADPTESEPVGYLEVKSVTYAPDPETQPGLVAFPDAVTARGLKHLQALSSVARSGQRAILLFCVNRDDAQQVTVAAEIDPAYAQGMRDAIDAGVEVIAYSTRINSLEHRLGSLLPFIFS